MSKEIMKAQTLFIDEDLKMLYTYQYEHFQNYIIHVLVAKSRSSEKFFISTAVSINGLYNFDISERFNTYLTRHDVERTSIVSDTFTSIKSVLNAQNKIASFIASSKDFPTILGTSLMEGLTIYYKVGGKLNIAKLEGAMLRIDLPEPSLSKMKEFMSMFNITVARKDGTDYDGLYINGN